MKVQTNHMEGAVVSYNWAHDSPKAGFRFDSSPGKLGEGSENDDDNDDDDDDDDDNDAPRFWSYHLCPTPKKARCGKWHEW